MTADDRRRYPPRFYQRGEMNCPCWCEAKSVFVTPDDVRAGRTYSCGRADCHPPALTGAYPGG